VVQWIEIDAKKGSVFVESFVHQGNEAAVSLCVVPHLRAGNGINFAVVDYVGERSLGIMQIVEREEFSIMQKEPYQLVILTLRVAKTLSYLLVLAISKSTWGRKDNFWQIRDRKHRTMDSLLLEWQLGFFNGGSDGTANPSLMVSLHLTQHRDAVRPWSVVNELMVVAADQEQVGVLVSILVRHGRVASRPLVTVADNVGHLSEDCGIVCFAARFNKPFSAARKGTDASRQHEQGLNFFLWNVAAQAITLHEARDLEKAPLP
jgi:hypothetical protein